MYLGKLLSTLRETTYTAQEIYQSAIHRHDQWKRTHNSITN